MDALEAIRKRRAVRTYTDQPVDDQVLNRLLKLALVAPTGGGSQAWSMMVIRDADRRRQIADLVIAGGAKYFAVMRPAAEGRSPAEHEQWAVDYAEQILGTYRIAPVWLVAMLVPRGNYPAPMAEGGHVDDVLSLQRTLTLFSALLPLAEAQERQVREPAVSTRHSEQEMPPEQFR